MQRQTLTELPGEINESTIVVEYFNFPLSEMDASCLQKIRKDKIEVNSNQLDITDIEYFNQQ